MIIFGSFNGENQTRERERKNLWLMGWPYWCAIYWEWEEFHINSNPHRLRTCKAATHLFNFFPFIFTVKRVNQSTSILVPCWVCIILCNLGNIGRTVSRYYEYLNIIFYVFRCLYISWNPVQRKFWKREEIGFFSCSMGSCCHFWCYTC